MTTFKPVVAGSVARRGPFTLRVNGVAQDLTDYELPTISFLNGAGEEVDEPGVVVLREPQATYPGQVYHDPHEDTFTRSTDTPFLAAETFYQRFTVEDSDGTPQDFPNGQFDRVPVYAR